MQHTTLTAPELAQALMNFAVQTGEAAKELLNTPAGTPFSDQTQRIIAVWTNIQPAPRVYLHPTEAAIDADTSTESFAVIVATRAIADAIEASALPPRTKVYAAIELAMQLAGHDADYVNNVLDEIRDFKSTPISIELVRETMSKALHMAASYGQQNEVLPPEMTDFVEHAMWMASSATIQYPAAAGAA